MSSGPDQPGPPDIDELLASLFRLYGQVAGALLKRRLGRRGERAQADIDARLIEHIERLVRVEGRNPSEPRSGTSGEPPAGGSYFQLRYASMRVESRTAESVVAAYSPAGVADQLQAATVTHIKAALRLSRQGSPAGARLHAALARTALETASEYMEKDQFLLFKSAVELRLRQLEGWPGADASPPTAGQ